MFPHYNVMGVAKAALEATVRYLANDLGPRNVRVNAISAGPIKTLAASGIPEFSRILQHYRESAPLGRTVDADEVAAAARFLLGPGGRGVTGEVLMVDGGLPRHRHVSRRPPPPNPCRRSFAASGERSSDWPSTGLRPLPPALPVPAERAGLRR